MKVYQVFFLNNYFKVTVSRNENAHIACLWLFYGCKNIFSKPHIKLFCAATVKWREQKITWKIIVSFQSTFLILPYILTGYNIESICSDDFASHNSRKPSFANIYSLCWFYWLWVFPWIEFSWYSFIIWDKNWKTGLILQFLCEGLSTYDSKGSCYSYAYSRSLFWRGTYFCMWFFPWKLLFICFFFDWL